MCFVAQCPRSVPPRVNRAAYLPNRFASRRSVRAPCLRASTAPPASLADVLCGAVSALRTYARQPLRLPACRLLCDVVVDMLRLKLDWRGLWLGGEVGDDEGGCFVEGEFGGVDGQVVVGGVSPGTVGEVIVV